MSRIYVAGKWETRRRVKAVALTLEDMGHTITYPWWDQEAESPLQAINDVEGVASADALVMVLELDYPYEGTLVELGVALGQGKPVFVLGNAAIIRHCLFFRHPLVRRGLSGLIQEQRTGDQIV